MPEFKPFFSGSAGLRIEVEDLGTGGSGSYSALLGDSVRQIAAQVARAMAAMEDDAPSELELEFHLSGSAAGGYTITRDASLHNFRVRMRWSSGPGSDALAPPARPV